VSSNVKHHIKMSSQRSNFLKWSNLARLLLIGIWLTSLSYHLVTLLTNEEGVIPLSSSEQCTHQVPLNDFHSSSSSSRMTKSPSENQFFAIPSSSSFFVLAQQCSESFTNNSVYCCPPPYQKEERKSKLTAFLLSFFLGILGIDRFFLGYYLMGVIKLLTIGGCGIWWVLDWILILADNVTDVRGCAMYDDVTPKN